MKDIEKVLVEAAKSSHESHGTAQQNSATASKLSDEIVAAIDRHAGLSFIDALKYLRKDNIKCQALLSSQMSPDDFAQQMMPSNVSPESSFEAANDITKVGDSQHLSSLANPPFKQVQHGDEAAAPGNNVPTEPGNSSDQHRESPLPAKSQAGVEANDNSSTVDFDHQSSPQLQEYLKKHRLSEEGSREELISRCLAKEKELSSQTATAPTNANSEGHTSEVRTLNDKSSTSNVPSPVLRRLFNAAVNPFRQR